MRVDVWLGVGRLVEMRRVEVDEGTVASERIDAVEGNVTELQPHKKKRCSGARMHIELERATGRGVFRSLMI